MTQALEQYVQRCAEDRAQCWWDLRAELMRPICPSGDACTERELLEFAFANPFPPLAALPDPAAVSLPAAGWLLLAAVAGLMLWRRG